MVLLLYVVALHLLLLVNQGRGLSTSSRGCDAAAVRGGAAARAVVGMGTPQLATSHG